MRNGLTMWPWLFWNLSCNPGWPQTHGYSFASYSQVGGSGRPGSAVALPSCLLKGRHRHETQCDGVFRSPLGSAQSCPELAAFIATVCASHPCLAEGWGTDSNRVPLPLLMWPQRWGFLPSLLYKLAVKASTCSVEQVGWLTGSRVPAAAASRTPRMTISI